MRPLSRVSVLSRASRVDVPITSLLHRVVNTVEKTISQVPQLSEENLLTKNDFNGGVPLGTISGAPDALGFQVDSPDLGRIIRCLSMIHAQDEQNFDLSHFVEVFKRKTRRL